ncbi:MULTISPECIES: hypothetical protein [unclassified Pseudomonas]|uniref:hypothetical protein n=1 Tax=unclassified Pseudomonas TaxID=196821 RepID=UPI000C86BA68|nr:MULTISPECIES: hypothetical protein [unclassified Pseudomonas]PMV17583.1 hypothetical protein C1X17_29660 [Pseudomonas sp. FW305-3-2-15-C-TSA2]PMV18557.1 hypothetical protein C1X22_29505 [Pseudomonas sp. DP16D-L5]PMV32312.1 hypothetical protein C1X21_29700 [Pseudomonas sp. FW305-3-2-15-A-LB2]PMV37981.1 hypothetical protein C1X16_29675 [Pseudomonas sp. FW305-3-2-15-C-R2A1]PMV41983.1 hypothetical protein C1X18_29835 [Pseudomonas sp. FW305-3-2-15-C-LB1]
MKDELDVAKRYGLFWASSLVEGEDRVPIADGTYIQQPERFSETFWDVFDKLHQLNDYCFLQLVAVEKQRVELFNQRESYLARPNQGAEEIDWLDDQTPRWEDNLAVVTQATSIVLLCSFMEWGLKRVAKDLYGVIPRKPARPAMSDIQFFLEHLKQSGLPFRMDPAVLDAIDSFRNVRNAFAHGEWASVEDQLAKISLLTCFESVAQVFACLESASWDGPWRNTTLDTEGHHSDLQKCEL